MDANSRNEHGLSHRVISSFRRSLAAQFAAILISAFIITAVSFASLYLKQETKNLHTLMLKQAEVLFNQIHLMRHWNAGYQGVYVLKTPGMQTNPYLYRVGPAKGVKADIRPEIQDVLGNTYTLKNPALMTRELAEITERESDIRFHLTSLNLINPNNKPDDFETRALKKFEQGSKTWDETITASNGTQRFRYMAPLKVEKACMQCHGAQGYKVGDIRGGISLDLPMDDAIAVSMSNRMITIAGGAGILGVMLLALWLSLRKLIINPVLELQKLARNIGSNEGHDITRLSRRRDEIGSLSRTMMATEKEVTRQQQELIQQASKLDDDRRHDPLTRLHNRRHLYLEGPGLFTMAHRLGYEVSAMMIDLDYFKKINDTHGHAAGDKVLIEVAEALLKHSRSYDLLIRFGGEEFTLVLLNCDQAQSIQIAERIRQDIEAMQITYEERVIPITCSIGISSSKEADLEQMMIQADEAVYLAKAAGRNIVRHVNFEQNSY